MLTNLPAFLSAHPWIIIVAAAWTIPWKGWALWRAARNHSVIWFILLLIINTLGILDILYIIFSSSKEKFPPENPGMDRMDIPEKRILDIKRDIM